MYGTFEDSWLEGDYEDRYTIQADINAEDDYDIEDEDESDEYLEDDISVRMHEYDEMRYPEPLNMPSYAS